MLHPSKSGIAGAAIATAAHRIMGCVRGAELLAVPAARPPSGTSALGVPCGSGALSAPGAIKARVRARQGALSDQGLLSGAARPSSSHGIFFLEVPAVPRSGHSVRGLPTFPT